MAEQTANPSPRSRFPGGKPVAILLLAVLSIAGAGGGFMLASMMSKDAEPEATAHNTAGGIDAAHAKPAGDQKNLMAVTPFKEIIVNINATTATGRTTSRFMKLNVALVYDAKLEGADRIEEQRLFIRDSFQDYLRQLTEHDLQGSLGLVIVKQELLHRARTITQSMAPQEILVADLIVQ